MGSGILKTLSFYKVPHDQFLYVFSSCGHSSEPCVGLLLWSLSGRPCNEGLLIFADASVINHCVVSLTRAQGPTLLTVGLVPCVLGAVATQMSLFMACVALTLHKSLCLP